MSRLRILPPEQPLCGSVPVPDDEEVLLLRLALSVLCRGTTTIETLGPLYGSPRVFADALELLGVGPSGRTGRGPQTLVLAGRGLSDAFAEPGPLDVRGEPAVAALLLGLSAGRASSLELLADDVVAQGLGEPLEDVYGVGISQFEEGVRITVPARPPGFRAPGLTLDAPGLVGWIKQAVLLLGLRASSPTVVTETIASTDDLERALLRSRVPVSIVGTSVELHPPRDADALAPARFEPVGSMSAATVLLAASVLVPGSHVVVRDVAVGPGRADALTLLRLMGAQVGLTPRGDRQGQPIAELSARGSPECRRASPAGEPWVLGGETLVRLADSALYVLPVIARSGGNILVTDLVAARRGADPRVFARAAGFLRSAGVDLELADSGIQFLSDPPPSEFSRLTLTTGGDGRLALLATLLALAADGASEIDDVDCLQGTFPRFVGTLRALGARLELVP